MACNSMLTTKCPTPNTMHAKVASWQGSIGRSIAHFCCQEPSQTTSQNCFHQCTHPGSVCHSRVRGSRQQRSVCDTVGSACQSSPAFASSMKCHLNHVTSASLVAARDTTPASSWCEWTSSCFTCTTGNLVVESHTRYHSMPAFSRRVGRRKGMCAGAAWLHHRPRPKA